MVRSFYSVETLLLTSKKPRIKELVANAKYMSDDEIMNLTESLSTRQGLLAIKFYDIDVNNLEEFKLTRGERIANLMMKSVVKSNSLNSAFDLTDIRIMQLNYEVIISQHISNELTIPPKWYWAKLSEKDVFLSTTTISNLTQQSMDILEKSSSFIKNGNIADLKELDLIRRDSLINKA